MSIEHPAAPWNSFSPTELFATLLYAMIEAKQNDSVDKTLDTILLNLSKKESLSSQSVLSIESNEKKIDEASLYADISQILTTLGIPASLLGYEYLRYGILFAVQDRDSLCGMTKILYPAIARKYQTSVSRIERAMRYAIEVSCTRGDPEAIYSLFGNTMNPSSGKPTNSEFISRVADKLRMDYSGSSLST